MHFFTFPVLISVATLAVALIPISLEDRSIGASCTTPYGKGRCQKTSSCTSQGFNLANHCPNDADDVQCCVKMTCKTQSGSGICMNTSDACGGAFVPNACPGESTIQCCVKSAKPPAPESDKNAKLPAPKPSNGDAIVSAAKSQEGLPYVWGGGGCNGKSNGGFDCSGLTQYSACKAQGITIPRVAQDQYHSRLGTHFPRAQAQAGDMLFWGGNGDCTHNVVHVGIFVRQDWMVNAARSGTPVREQKIWTSSGSEEICDDAVRFW